MAMLDGARQRARRKGLEFTLTLSDIRIPKYCPALGIEMLVSPSKVSDNSPSLDRIDNHRGYTPDNIAVISHRANALKTNATIEELKSIIQYIESYSNG